MKSKGAPAANSSTLLSAKSIKFSAKQFERPGLSEDEVT